MMLHCKVEYSNPFRLQLAAICRVPYPTHTPRTRVACAEKFLTPATADVIASQRSGRFDVAAVGATRIGHIESDATRVDSDADPKRILGYVSALAELERRSLKQ